MKEKIKKYGLELILGVGAVVSLFSVNAKASTLSNVLDCNNPNVQTSSSQLTHHSMPYLFNYPFIDGHTPAIDIYYLDGTTPTKGIGKPAESMETEAAYIRGRGLDSNGVPAQLSANISEASWYGEDPENNMLYKKVIGRLYEIVDGNDVLRGTYDCWNITESGQKVDLTVKNGSSHKWITSFYNTNIADFDNDGKVDFKDFVYLSNDWGNAGNYLTDISGLEGKSDGHVDCYDLDAFCDNWLE